MLFRLALLRYSILYNKIAANIHNVREGLQYNWYINIKYFDRQLIFS